jgi:hypothetical protein
MKKRKENMEKKEKIIYKCLLVEEVINILKFGEIKIGMLQQIIMIIIIKTNWKDLKKNLTK